MTDVFAEVLGEPDVVDAPPPTDDGAEQDDGEDD